jgi:hypothetical protein
MTEARKKEIKEMYLEYLEDIPVHKWASYYCRISEDTSKRLRDEDSEFADACKARISAFVRRTAKRAKPEFQLERLLKEDFSQLTKTDITSNGQTITPVLVEFLKKENKENEQSE